MRLSLVLDSSKRTGIVNARPVSLGDHLVHRLLRDPGRLAKPGCFAKHLSNVLAHA